MTEILPIAAVVAISLFVTKESFEIVRRYRERGRKLRAVKALIRDEVKANHIALNHLSMAICMAEATPDYEGAKDAVVTGHGGRLFYRRFDEDGSVMAGSMLRAVRQTEYQRLLPQAAELSPKLYRILRDGYSHVSELDHILTSFADHAGGIEDEREWFPPFREWARDRLIEISSDLIALYKSLGGDVSDIKVPPVLRKKEADT
jgi:hypothetical protein